MNVYLKCGLFFKGTWTLFWHGERRRVNVVFKWNAIIHDSWFASPTLTLPLRIQFGASQTRMTKPPESTPRTPWPEGMPMLAGEVERKIKKNTRQEWEWETKKITKYDQRPTTGVMERADNAASSSLEIIAKITSCAWIQDKPFFLQFTQALFLSRSRRKMAMKKEVQALENFWLKKTYEKLKRVECSACLSQG